MRIAVVSESFLPAVDGTTTTVRAVVDRLVDRGHQVVVVASGPGLATYRGARVVRVSALTRPGGQVRAALDAFAPDVVQVTGPGTIGRKALKHTHRTGVPSLVVQQTPPRDLTWERWRSTVAERTDHLVVTAPWLADRFSSLGVTAGTWLPGVDARAYTPALRDPWLHDHWARARSARGPLVVVGYVGSLHKRHGVRRLAELADVPGIRPVVIGTGPQEDWLRERLPAAKVTGALSTGDLTVALASLDVLVHPGEEETCCHALREGAASALPLVAPRSGGARDLVLPLETGLLYDPDRPGALARAVAAVAADPRRALLGHRGRELSLDRSWTDAADELLGHLDRLARGHAGARPAHGV